ncbi:hypothetical protein [Formosa sp. S-31]|uniref:hypothetical protein n=1 Tax=Formosa sp. S-31 TaxID=2790949 RepID=UPI003EBA4DFD
MRSLLVLLIYMSCFSVFAQKHIEKHINNAGISTVYINGNTCYKIHVTTKKSESMAIKTRIAGEHYEDMMIISEQKSDTLFIRSGFHPLFTADNDKLSAHKVMSIEMEVELPEHLNLYVHSDIGLVEVIGQYNNAILELRDGSCSLYHFQGNARVNTVNGDIKVETNYTKVTAESRHGILLLSPLVPGQNEIMLKSIHGDISVYKTE